MNIDNLTKGLAQHQKLNQELTDLKIQKMILIKIACNALRI